MGARAPHGRVNVDKAEPVIQAIANTLYLYNARDLRFSSRGKKLPGVFMQEVISYQPSELTTDN